MPKTNTVSNEGRTFVCKRCGEKVTESLRVWKKKPQKEKRVCECCRKRQAIARQTAAERSHYAGYGNYKIY